MYNLKLNSYLHITSPIRRIVDLLNLIQMQTNLGVLIFGIDAGMFYSNWIARLDYINKAMRATRKSQNICNVMALFNGDFKDDIYEGYVFDRVTRNDGLYQYLVYIPELKLLNKYTSRLDHINYSKHHYKLYLFEDEDTFKKKIMFNFEE